jgi:hypothetical protein
MPHSHSAQSEEPHTNSLITLASFRTKFQLRGPSSASGGFGMTDDYLRVEYWLTRLVYVNFKNS